MSLQTEVSLNICTLNCLAFLNELKWIIVAADNIGVRVRPWLVPSTAMSPRPGSVISKLILFLFCYRLLVQLVIRTGSNFKETTSISCISLKLCYCSSLSTWQSFLNVWQSFSWSRNCPISCKSTVYCYVHKNVPMNPILSQLNPVYLISYVLSRN
jgi:hypothetical protein